MKQLLKPGKPSSVFSSPVQYWNSDASVQDSGRKHSSSTSLCLSCSQWQRPVPALTCLILFWCTACSDQGKTTNGMKAIIFPFRSLMPEAKARLGQSSLFRYIFLSISSSVASVVLQVLRKRIVSPHSQCYCMPFSPWENTPISCLKMHKESLHLCLRTSCSYHWQVLPFNFLKMQDLSIFILFLSLQVY